MSLLQNPVNVIDQIEWFLANRQLEKFPASFVLAAGNLARQLLEQVLFILAFYGCVPKRSYLKTDQRLRVANDLITALRSVDPTTGTTYLENARLRGPRIAKFARLERSFDRWRDLFNEPSHFRNPASSRHTREHHVKSFAKRMKQVVDDRDSYLITAAVNELRSGGSLRAVLGKDERNTPGIQFDMIVSARNLVRKNGRLALEGPKTPLQIVPHDREFPVRWPKVPVIVQGSEGISINWHMKTKDGYAIDLRTFETIILSLSQTERERKQLERRLRKLGCTIEWQFGAAQTSADASNNHLNGTR